MPDLRRQGGFTPNSDSLRKAKELADALGLPFDPTEVVHDARDLHARYFQRICELVGAEPSEPLGFVHGDFRLIQAMAGPTEGGAEVRFDQQVDHWFMGVCHLVFVAAAFQLEPPQYGRLTDHYDTYLDWRLNPFLLEKHREAHWEFFVTYARAWEITHPLSRAMTIFVLCHELAHVTLGHTEIDAKDPAHEIEADAKAADYFLRIVGAGPSAGEVCISPKLLSAPLLTMRLFEAERRKHQLDYSGGDYPTPLKRLTDLQSRLQPHMIEAASHLGDGLLKTFDQLDEKLERRKADRAMT